MPFVEASYTRYFDRDHLPVQELVYPEVRVTTTITGDSDLNMVNNALRHGHVVCLEPRYFHAGLSAVPRLAAYAREVLRVRRLLRNVLWDGRLADPGRAVVQGSVLHGVFAARAADPGAGTLAVVLDHFEPTAQPLTLDIPGAAREVVVHRPFREPERARLPLATEVPAREFVVLVANEGQASGR